MKMVVSIDIHAPVEKVYAFFADIENADKHITAIEKIEMLKKPDNGLVGARWKETRTEFGKQDTIEIEITEAEENLFYKAESLAHGMHYITLFRFEKLDDQSTRMSVEFSGKAQKLSARLMSFMMIFFKGAVKKSFMRDFEEAKQILEA